MQFGEISLLECADVCWFHLSKTCEDDDKEERPRWSTTWMETDAVKRRPAFNRRGQSLKIYSWVTFTRKKISPRMEQ